MSETPQRRFPKQPLSIVSLKSPVHDRDVKEGTSSGYIPDDGVPDTGDTAWMLASAALVLLMTPGLAFFYGGMVRARACST